MKSLTICFAIWGLVALSHVPCNGQVSPPDKLGGGQQVTELTAETEAEPIDVKVVFVNFTDGPVTFRVLLQPEDDQSQIEEVPVHANAPLNPNHERTYDSKSGMLWEILNKKGEPIALWVTGIEPRQSVDIRKLVALQKPIQVNFQNNTTENVDIYWMQPDGELALIVKDMPPGTELKDQPLRSLPNQMWTITQKGEFFADYFTGSDVLQTVDLKDLKTWFEPVEVTFANTTGQLLRVFLTNLDNQEIEYTLTPEGKTLPLESNQALVTPANPLTRWVIKVDTTVVAEYRVTNEKKQAVEISDEFLKNAAADK